MKLEMLDIELRYTGKYRIRIGQFYWLPAIKNPNNSYEVAHVKGVHKIDAFNIKVEEMTEEDIFKELELYDDQVIMSLEPIL